MKAASMIRSAASDSRCRKEQGVEAISDKIKDHMVTNNRSVFLEGVRAGEECEIMFSAKYGFGNRTLGIIPAKTALLYRIWVTEVTND